MIEKHFRKQNKCMLCKVIKSKTCDSANKTTKIKLLNTAENGKNILVELCSKG